MVTVKSLLASLSTMPGDAVVHLCIDGIPYLPLIEVKHEPNPPQDGGPGVALVMPDQTRLVEELGIDGPIRKLLEDIRDNYEPELIAHDCAVEALALLDGVGAKMNTRRSP